MSTAHVSADPGGDARDMAHVHAGGARWRRQQERLKKRQLKADLAAARKREAELQRGYTRAFERAARMSERRGVGAIAEAFDEADRMMNRLTTTRATVGQLEAQLRSTRS